MTIYDVLVIGGGPAGLGAATALVRQLANTVVFDSGVYRNARATNLHNVAGFDHVPPADFRAKVRADILTRYQTVRFESVEIALLAKVEPEIPGKTLFRAVAKGTDARTWLGRKVVLAAGVRDVMIDIPGYEECWGRSIFHCLFCHGYEERGAESAGVLLAHSPLVEAGLMMHIAAQTAQAQNLAKNVTLYTDGDEARATMLQSHFSDKNYKVEPRKIRGFARGNGSQIVIIFEDGDSVAEGFLAHAPAAKINGPFVEQLGIEVVNDQIRAKEPFGETNVPGIYAAGDCAVMIKGVPVALSTGQAAGAMAVMSVLAEGPLPPDAGKSAGERMSAKEEL